MTIVIEIYIVVCVLLLLFDIGFLLVKHSKNDRLHPKEGAFARSLQREIRLHQQEGAFSAAFEKN